MRHFLLGMLIAVSFWRVCWRIQDRFFPGTLRLTIFDVGQGDGTLVQFPKGSTLLIDAGRGFRGWDIGKAVLVRELSLRAILTIDYLLMTHPDQDHSFGLRGILSELKVKEFWTHQPFFEKPNGVTFERMELARKRGAKLVGIDKDTVRSIEGVEAHFIPLHVGRSTNNNGVINYFVFGKCRALLMADAEASAEATLRLPQTVQVLKVGHHGSKTSSTLYFLRQVKPKLGVISVGYQNHYGHPHREVIDRYRSEGIELLRTDFHGMTTLESDGRSWKCSTALGSCGTTGCEDN